MPIAHTSRRQSLEAILEALKAYEPHQLTTRARQAPDGICCALGVYSLRTHGTPEADCHELYPDVYSDVVTANDTGFNEGPLTLRRSQRYVAVLKWLEEEIEACKA